VVIEHLRAELTQQMLAVPSSTSERKDAERTPPRAERPDRKSMREAKRSGESKKRPGGDGDPQPASAEPSKPKEPALCRFDVSFGKQCRLAERCKFRHTTPLPAESAGAPAVLSEPPAPAPASSRAAGTAAAASKRTAARPQPSPLGADVAASPSTAQPAKDAAQPQAAAVRAQHRFAHSTVWSALGSTCSDGDDDDDEDDENTNPNEGAKAAPAAKAGRRTGQAGQSAAGASPAAKAAVPKGAGAPDAPPHKPVAKPVQVDACSALEQSDYGTVGVRWKKGKEHEYEDRSVAHRASSMARGGQHTQHLCQWVGEEHEYEDGLTNRMPRPERRLRRCADVRAQASHSSACA
jgi:hypothetical protein